MPPYGGYKRGVDKIKPLLGKSSGLNKVSKRIDFKRKSLKSFKYNLLEVLK